MVVCGGAELERLCVHSTGFFRQYFFFPFHATCIPHIRRKLTQSSTWMNPGIEKWFQMQAL
jgi:hypothetical protein